MVKWMASSIIYLEKIKKVNNWCDNLSRRKWVNESMSNSAITIKSIQKELKLQKFGFKNIQFVNGNVKMLIYKKIYLKNITDIVLHCASQPSAPFANSSLSRATFTLKITIFLCLIFYGQ